MTFYTHNFNQEKKNQDLITEADAKRKVEELAEGDYHSHNSCMGRRVLLSGAVLTLQGTEWKGSGMKCMVRETSLADLSLAM